MKKTNCISIVIAIVMSICLIVCFTSCPQPEGTGAEGASNTLQAQIDATAAGGTVTLSPSNEGTSISISKAITVNGSGIENLSIVVNANIANDVTLINFVNASVTVTNSANSAHSAFSRSVVAARDVDGGDEETVMPKELGDDNPKLRLEDSTFRKISAGRDVTLFLDTDDNKVTIEELELKADVEQFVLISDEEEDTQTDEKSAIEKLLVEAGVDEVNLIGSVFDDLEFKGEFSDKVDFYYEEKSDDQAGEDFKARLAEATAQAKAMDVCNVRNGAGVYKVTVPKAKIEAIQGEIDGREGLFGSVFIMLLTDDQKDAFLESIPEGGNPYSPELIYVGPKEETGWNWATIDKPYFDIGYTGSYLFVTDDEELHAVSGDSSSLYIVEDESFEYFDYYRSYSADALCSQCSGDYITIYLDVSRLRKSDLNTCAYKEDGYTDEYYLTPNKLTEIDLTGYKPYIAVDFAAYDALASSGQTGWEEKKPFATSVFGESSLNDVQIQTPVSKSNNGGDTDFSYVFMFPMDEADSYPTEAATWKQIECPPAPQWD